MTTETKCEDWGLYSQEQIAPVGVEEGMSLIFGSKNSCENMQN